MSLRAHSSGFTMIELIVVVTILGLLASVVVPISMVSRQSTDSVLPREPSVRTSGGRDHSVEESETNMCFATI